MNSPENAPLTRRVFLERSVGLASAAAVGSLSLNSLAGEKGVNRLSYDVTRFAITDPKLVKYEMAAKFHTLAPRTRRIWALPEGFLIACESGIVRFSKDGIKATEYPTPIAARCVTQAPDGTVYAATREGIHSFGKDGKQLQFWAAPNSKSWFTGLAADEENVFAGDSGNRVVLRFDRSGKLLNKIGEKNKEKEIPGIVLPSPYLHVALGKDGLLRVNNTGRHRVELYTAEGDLELTWGKPSAGIEGFCGCCNPVGLAMLPDGRCVTAEKGLPRVKVYSAEGAFESVVAGTEAYPENSRHGAARDPKDGTMGGLDVAVGNDGKILVLDLVTGNVHAMRPKTS